jgi:hypothetical protein
MKFDLHSDLANRVTVMNLKWHRDGLAEDLAKENYFRHEEDRSYYSNLLSHLDEVLGYFGGDL